MRLHVRKYNYYFSYIIFLRQIYNKKVDLKANFGIFEMYILIFRLCFRLLLCSLLRFNTPVYRLE